MGGVSAELACSVPLTDFLFSKVLGKMSLSETSTIKSFGEESYHRIYIPNKLRSDASYPFDAGLDVRLQAVGPMLLVVPERCGSLAEQVSDVVEEEVLDGD